MEKDRIKLALAWAILLCLPCEHVTYCQDVRIVKEVHETGVIRDLKPGLVSLTTADNRVVTCKIQDKDEQAISIGGVPIRIPATITVSGSLPTQLIEKGMIVQFEGQTNHNGRTDGEIQQLIVLSDSSMELKVEFIKEPEAGGYGPCIVVGRVVSLSKQKLLLQVPKSKFARKEKITFQLAEDGVMLVTADDLNRVRAGDEVTHMLIYELSNGETICKEIDVHLTANRDKVTTSFHDQLDQEFSGLSDEPGEPREVRSANFVLYTDVSDRNAKILLAKLETMHELIGGYFGKRPRIPVECYVVADLKKWKGKELHPAGIAKIVEPAGITLTVRSNASGETKAVVYSCDRHSIVQHEAVHAFCAQAFGSPGPVWYSEGMAEMGQYWKPGELAVNIDPVVIDYLTHAPPKKMQDIVAAGQITGDSWQAYAWRWALCHLLANNPNYEQRFKLLGINMMAGRVDSFEKAFGNVADRISFEYDQFVQNFGNGYRVDLSAWDWSVSASNLDGNGRTKATIRAQAGWQPTKLETRLGVSYDFIGQGDWKTSPGQAAVTADGDPVTGQGKLIGVLLHDFQIEGPFDFGTKGSFVAPVTGQLYLRCQDSWTELANNEGELTVHLRRSSKDSTTESGEDSDQD